MTIRDDQVASQGREAWRNNAGRKSDNAVKGLAALIVVALLAFMIFTSAGTENDGRTSVSQTTNAGQTPTEHEIQTLFRPERPKSGAR